MLLVTTKGNPNYRLHMTDKDQGVTYSKVIYIITAEQTGEISIFPNPIVDLRFNLKLKEAGAAEINVYSLDGRRLYSITVQGQLQYVVKLPQSTASSKWLVIQVKSGNKSNSFAVLNKQ